MFKDVRLEFKNTAILTELDVLEFFLIYYGCYE